MTVVDATDVAQSAGAAAGRRLAAAGGSAPYAIVGSGLVGLVAFATLRYRGVPTEEIVVFGPQPDPAAAWRVRASCIRQRTMRSESNGHCGATAFPGLAVREALRCRHPLPLLRSITDRYRPTVDLFLDHVEQTRAGCGWDSSFRETVIDELEPVRDGFLLDGHGPYQHVLLALGHPDLNVPAEYASDPRAVHAYEPHEYGRTVAVVGAGMAAATEWLNALDAGATVESIRRREPRRQPLNLPRPMFTRRGLATYHRLPPERRASALREWLAPSYPAGRQWDGPLFAVAGTGRYRVVAEPSDDADQIICATGFRRGFEAHRLLRSLAARASLPVVESWLALDDDCSVPGLTDGARTLAVSGVRAQWAFPAADTLMGARYAAHCFVQRAVRCRTR